SLSRSRTTSSTSRGPWKSPAKPGVPTGPATRRRIRICSDSTAPAAASPNSSRRRTMRLAAGEKSTRVCAGRRGTSSCGKELERSRSAIRRCPGRVLLECGQPTGSRDPMYTSFFGLNEKPFSITPDPRYLYLSERHREALAHLIYGIKESGGFIQLTGEVGTGKTTLVRTLLQQLPEFADVAVVLNPQLSRT